ncbi:hypothetical protein ACIQ2D_20590 [Lysinibacillus sp. NPDC097287]|uniref:hypothetical protein n=1 Tax=Lysinibacillus sp. NPDC097287 TaxID=3364144 RepID=UPI0038220990
MQLMDIIKEFDSRISPKFQTLPIKISCYSTAIGGHREYSIDFDFFTNTKINTYAQEANTYITSIQGKIPGTIDLGHQDNALWIVPQSVHIECSYKLLCIDRNDMKRILQHPQPILHYSEWVVDAIKHANILVDVKTNKNTITEWPLGIKSAAFL